MPGDPRTVFGKSHLIGIRLDPGRLDELIARARRQADLLEELRVRAAGQVIGLEATADG